MEKEKHTQRGRVRSGSSRWGQLFVATAVSALAAACAVEPLSDEQGEARLAVANERVFDVRVDSRKTASYEGGHTFCIPGARSLRFYLSQVGDVVDVYDKFDGYIKSTTSAGLVKVATECATLRPRNPGSFFVLNQFGAVILATDGAMPVTETLAANLSTGGESQKVLALGTTRPELAFQVKASLMVHALANGAELVVADLAGNEQRIAAPGPIWTRRFAGGVIEFRCEIGGEKKALNKCPLTVVEVKRFGYRVHVDSGRFTHWLQTIQNNWLGNRAADFENQVSRLRNLLPLLGATDVVELANQYTSHIDKEGADGLEWAAMFVADGLARIDHASAWPAFVAMRNAFIRWHDERACGLPKVNMAVAVADGSPAIGGANARPMAYLALSEIANRKQLKNYRAASYAGLVIRRLAQILKQGGAGIGILRADNGRCGEYALPQAYIPVEVHPLAVVSPVVLDKDEFRRAHVFVGPAVSDIAGHKSSLDRLREIGARKDLATPGVARDALACVGGVADAYDTRVYESDFNLELQKSVRKCLEETCSYSGGLRVSATNLLDPDSTSDLESLCLSSKGGLGRGHGPGASCDDAIHGYGVAGVSRDLCRIKLPNADELQAHLANELVERIMCLEAIREAANPPSDPLAVHPGLKACIYAGGGCLVVSAMSAGVGAPACAVPAIGVCAVGAAHVAYDHYQANREDPDVSVPPKMGTLECARDCEGPGATSTDGKWTCTKQEDGDTKCVAVKTRPYRGWFTRPEAARHTRITSADGMTVTEESESHDGTRVNRKMKTTLENGNTVSTEERSVCVELTNGSCTKWETTIIEETCTKATNECRKKITNPNHSTSEPRPYKMDESRPAHDSPTGPLPDECTNLTGNRFDDSTGGNPDPVDPMNPSNPDVVSCNSAVADAFVANGSDFDCPAELVNCSAESECCCAGANESRPPRSCPVTWCPEGSQIDYETCGCRDSNEQSWFDPPYIPPGLGPDPTL